MQGRQSGAAWTRADLNDGYNNTDAVSHSGPDHGSAGRCAAPRCGRQTPRPLDLAYGPNAAHQDRSAFSAACRTRRCSCSFMAATGSATKGNLRLHGRGPLARGFDVAVPGYTLAPDATADARSSTRFIPRSAGCGPRGRNLARGDRPAGAVGLVGRRSPHGDGRRHGRSRRRAADQRHLRYSNT